MRGIKKFVPALVVFSILTACAKTDVAEIEQTNAITSATKETEAAKKEQEEKARPELSDTVDNISEYDRDRCWSDFHGDCKTCWSRQKNRHG